MIFSSETRKTIPSLNPTAIMVLYTVYLQYNIVIGHGAVITTDHFAYKNKVIALMFRQRFFLKIQASRNYLIYIHAYICVCACIRTHDPTEDAFYARMETILPFYCYCTVARFASMLGSSALRTQKRARLLSYLLPSLLYHIQTLPYLSRNNFQ